MSPQQALAFAILGAAVAMFAWARLRYDVVALGALLVGMATGLVPTKLAFSGFTSDVVVIIASALVVSAAVEQSGAIELFSCAMAVATELGAKPGAGARRSNRAAVHSHQEHRRSWPF